MDKPLPSKAIETGDALLSHEDMRDREESILADIKKQTGFTSQKVIWRSDYLGTGRVGAINYLGDYENKKVVLKVQGVKPEVSEWYMIEEFRKQNKSKLVRPPFIHRHLPWNEKEGYEAFLMEEVTGDKIIESGKILTEKEINNFMKVYKEYKENCVSQPWLPKPATDPNDDMASRLKKMISEVKPNSPLRQPGDWDLAVSGYEILKKIWTDKPLQFLHGHFSAEDLMRQGDEIVVFSNLFWKWKSPFYDLVFGYHWVMYTLGRIKDITPEQIEEQRRIWLAALTKTAEEINPQKGKIFLSAALLERAIAGLLIDGHAYLDENDPITKHLIEKTRQQLISLTQELK